MSGGIAGQTKWTEPSSSASAAAAVASVSAPASIGPFIPADAFSRPRPGYVYKQGSQGTGYYEDAGPMAVQGGQAITQHADTALGKVKVVSGKAAAANVASDKQPASTAAKQASKKGAPVPQSAAENEATLMSVGQPAAHDSAATLKASSIQQPAMSEPAAAASLAVLSRKKEPAMLVASTSGPHRKVAGGEGGGDSIMQSSSKVDSEDAEAGIAAAGNQLGQSSGAGNKRKNQDPSSIDDCARRLYVKRNVDQVNLLWCTVAHMCSYIDCQQNECRLLDFIFPFEFDGYALCANMCVALSQTFSRRCHSKAWHFVDIA